MFTVSSVFLFSCLRVALTARGADRSDTQPTRSRLEVDHTAKPVLGGTKAGNMAWGLAWVDTIMEPRIEDENAHERERLIREADEHNVSTGMAVD